MKLEFLMFTKTASIFNNDDLGHISTCFLKADYYTIFGQIVLTVVDG